MLKGAGRVVDKGKKAVKERLEAKDTPAAKPGKPMSDREAEELRETYTQALRALFDFADDTIKFTSGGHEDPEIWSTVDDDDLSLIVTARLNQAKHSAKVAASVHRTISLYQRAAVYIVVGPRCWQSLVWYADHGFDLPVNLRKRRKLRVVKQQQQKAAVVNE